MLEAIKTSVKSAAKKYGINLSTLQRHIKKGCPEKKLGRFTIVPVLGCLSTGAERGSGAEKRRNINQ
jgi:hypothetical protein